MNLHTSTSTVGDLAVVAVDGIVDLSTIATLHHDLTRAVRDHPGRTVLVDLDATTSLDDAALGILLGAAAAARRGGGDLGVVCSRPALRERLTITRFDRAVTVRESIT